jgi:Ca2+-transporting ATPase
MNEVELGQLLLSLSVVFALTYTLGYLLARFRIPSILAALFVGIALSYIPLFSSIHLVPAFENTYTFLADLGVLFLLFHIGLQIELGEMKKSGHEIIWLTVLNTLFPFLFGTVAMLATVMAGQWHW